MYMSRNRTIAPVSRSPVRSFLKYSFFLITIVSSGVFFVTGKPLVLIGEVLRTIAPDSIASVCDAFMNLL